MINISLRDTIPNLITAVEKLPDSTVTCDAPFTASVKALALAQINSVAALNADPVNKVNGANLNVRANAVGLFRQVDIQVSAYYQKPAVATPVV